MTRRRMTSRHRWREGRRLQIRVETTTARRATRTAKLYLNTAFATCWDDASLTRREHSVILLLHPLLHPSAFLIQLAVSYCFTWLWILRRQTTQSSPGIALMNHVFICAALKPLQQYAIYYVLYINNLKHTVLYNDQWGRAEGRKWYQFVFCH